MRKDHFPQKKLKLKPALRKTDVPSEKVKHIRFDVIGSNNNEDIEAQKNDLLSAPKANEDETGVKIHERKAAENSTPAASTSPENNRSDISLGSENLNSVFLNFF